MDTPLLGPITKAFTDRSTSKAFSFGFHCDKCGKEWRSAPQAFVPGAPASVANLRVYRMLWNGQRKAAYEQANLKAIYMFHFCPACGRRMCAECFQRSETDIAELCRDCQAGKDQGVSADIDRRLAP